MNEKRPNNIIIGLLGLIFILGVIFVSVYLTPKTPVSLRPRAEQVNHRLGFHIADNDNQHFTLRDEVALTPGKQFALAIMLSKGASLEKDKKYKFHLKFDYNASVLTLNTFQNRELNNDEVGDPNIIATDPLFTEAEFNKVKEEENGKVEIEGFFKSSNSYADLVEKEGVRNNDRVLIVQLRNFEVKKEAVLESTTSLFKWYRDGETKVSRDDTIKDDDRQLTLVDKEIGDILASGAITTPDGQPPPDTGGTTTTTSGGAMTLNLSLKFQGILSKPASGLEKMLVKITVVGGSSASPVSQTQTADFLADDNGIWKGNLSFNSIPSGSGYRILVKGPQHSQKKICDEKPSEPSNAGGSYSCGDGKIALKQGDNPFDFTGIALLVGDLPVQDGVVNAYDAVLVRELIISQDPKRIGLADLNRSGEVNAQDFALLVYSLQVKGDEQ